MLKAFAATHTHITTATTTQVVTGPATLVAIVFNKPVASSTVSIYDSASTTTPVVALITNTTDVKPYMLFYGVHIANGIRIVTSSTDDISVIWEGA